MRVLVPLGTRPEIIKLAPVVVALERAGIEVRTVATGQHHDASLTDAFFDELGLHPAERWELTGGDAHRYGQLFARAAAEVAARHVDLVLVLGDTNTVPAFCLAARRARVPVAHLEAGMRSFNQTSVEEVNRRIAAACASLHFAPTALAAHLLEGEGVPSARIRVVGNPVTDVLAARGVARRSVGERKGVLFTAHRATNVDDPGRLDALMRIVGGLAELAPPVVFPVHPRTARRLAETGLDAELAVAGVERCAPLPYGDMLDALSRATLVVTDSGGLQEEASWLGIPTVILRRSTPRWEGVAAGASVLVGVDPDRALTEAARLVRAEEQARVAAIPCPYGDGTTGSQVAAVLADPDTQALLELAEPDYTDGSLPEDLADGPPER